MARYKQYDYGQMQLVPVSFAHQVPPGTFEYALSRLIDEHLHASARFGEGLVQCRLAEDLSHCIRPGGFSLRDVRGRRCLGIRSGQENTGSVPRAIEGKVKMPTQESASDRRTRYYRWALGLFGGYLIFGIVLAVILLTTITDANAGYPALFFGGLFAAAGFPISVACAVLAGKSLARREPRRLAVISVLIISCLGAWILLNRILRIIWQQLT